MRMRAIRLPVIFGALALLGAGCGSGESSPSVPSGGGTPIPLDQLVDQYSNAYCDAIGPCCSQAGLAYDKASCVQVFQKLLQTTVNAVNGGKAKYDGTAAGNCLAALPSLVDGCKFDGAAPDACDQVITGTVAEGGSCASSSECLTPPGGRASCSSGKCVVHARGTNGSACSETCTQRASSRICYGSGGTSGASCYTNDGLYCNGSTNQCTAMGSVGDACDGSDQSCTADTYCASGSCAQRKNIGDACTFNGCVADAYCANGSCQAQKPPGSSCTSSEECANGVCSSSVCKTSNTDLSLICK